MFGFAFFIVMSLLGNEISTRLSLPIPGSIIGLTLVFAMCCVRGKVDEPLKAAADSMLRYLALMLVPIGVGIVKLIDVVPQGMPTLIAVLALALAVGAVATAKLAQTLLTCRRLHPSALGRPVQSAHQ